MQYAFLTLNLSNEFYIFIKSLRQLCDLASLRAKKYILQLNLTLMRKCGINYSQIKELMTRIQFYFLFAINGMLINK